MAGFSLSSMYEIVLGVNRELRCQNISLIRCYRVVKLRIMLRFCLSVNLRWKSVTLIQLLVKLWANRCQGEIRG